MPQDWQNSLVVLYEGQGDILDYQQLAETLAVPLLSNKDTEIIHSTTFFLSWRDGCLKLIDHHTLKNGGVTVEVEPRPGEQRSWPAPKDGVLAKALGRKTHTVVDATTGWGQDSLVMFRMGYQLQCIERSAVMAVLLADGFKRLQQLDWVRRLQLPSPQLLVGNAIDILACLTEPPDCIYLDPMFPAKRKKSALAKKSIMMLRDLVGDDTDKEQLFTAAFNAAGKRVVVKSPDYAKPLGGKPSDSFQGKLLRYDVYLK